MRDVEATGASSRGHLGRGALQRARLETAAYNGSNAAEEVFWITAQGKVVNLMNLVVAALIFAVSVGAQAQERISIGILQFQQGGGVSHAETQAVEQFVVSRLSSDRRFRVLDRSRLNAIQAERNLQGALNALEKTAIADTGAQFVVAGEVSQADTAREYVQNVGTQYRSTVTYGLRILDVGTGEVVYSEQFSSGRNAWGNIFTGLNSDKSTPAGALDLALKITGKQMDEFLAGAFPITGVIVSVEEADRRGVPSQVLVTLGSEDGLIRSSKLGAFLSEAIEAGGRTLIRKRAIAELTLVRIEGDHLAVFRVNSGGPAIAQMIEQGRELKVEVKP